MTAANDKGYEALFEQSDGKLRIILKGQISSNNATLLEAEVREAIQGAESVVIDCAGLTYISSAGLRVVLRVKKKINDVVLINVCPEVYEIFSVTGFTEMMDIRKAVRHLSVEGCEVIGEGANGIVYRYDEDTIVKVFKNPDALPDIERERELARTAFVLGVPTAISYDIVQIDNGLYGSVFEMLNADNYNNMLISGKYSVEAIAEMCVEILKIVHSTYPKQGVLPPRKDISVERLKVIKDSQVLPEELYAELEKKVLAIREDTHMLHGDFHLKNIMYQDGESLLIDMDTLCVGNTIYEIAGMYMPYVGFAEIDPQDPERFFGLSKEVTGELYNCIVDKYFEDTPELIETIKKKAIVLCAGRMLYYAVTGKHVKEDQKDRMIEYCIRQLNKYLPELDELYI